MTMTDTITYITDLITLWRADEIRWLRAGEAVHARECRLRIATLEQLAADLAAKAAA